MNKIKWPALPKIRQTPLTRIAAALIALVLIAVLILVVDRQVGNPVSARWTVHAINDALQAKYPNEGYVVGKARYSYADGKLRYVCPVYQTGKEDVGFSAYLSGGQVYANRATMVESGLNTSNRLRNELAAQLDTNQLCRDLKGYSPYETTLTFYPNGNEQVFDPQNPLFETGMEFSADNLPLPTVLYTDFHAADREPPELTLEEAATYLVALKQAAANQGLAYDYYSATVCGLNTTWLLLDVPADAIPDQLPDESETGNTQPSKGETDNPATTGETPAEESSPEDGSFAALVALLDARIRQNDQSSDIATDASPADKTPSLNEQRLQLLYDAEMTFQPL